jgi:hypothetical protein
MQSQNILIAGIPDIIYRFSGKEGLMSSDQNIREGLQPDKGIVLDNLIG